ncbi:MAG: glycerol acyltransferase [Bacteroidales bacterium]|nr:glycerol acyltransferase [Bacteroidales bacterium]
MTSADYTIDIGHILRKKFGPKVPGWVIRMARRLLHEDFLNEFFKEGYTGVEFARKGLEYMQVTLQVEGLERIPKEGRFTIASNHALGGNDALALVALFGEHFEGHIRIMVNDFLMALKQLDTLFVPVNKVGAQSRDLPALTDSVFSSDEQVLMFPAGKCARRIDGKIQDPEWRKTFVTKSVQYRRDIVPMHFYGRNSWRFYFLDWIGRVTRINRKFPLAMVLLVDEMYRARGRSYRIVVGEPVPWQTFDSSRRPQEWVRWIRERVYAL